jgi:hypothetical protein
MFDARDLTAIPSLRDAGPSDDCRPETHLFTAMRVDQRSNGSGGVRLLAIHRRWDGLRQPLGSS